MIGLLSIPLRIIVDEHGDKILTDPEYYMNTSDIKEFGSEKLNMSEF
jgi:hypothetical protein